MEVKAKVPTLARPTAGQEAGVVAALRCRQDSNRSRGLCRSHFHKTLALK